MAEASEAAITAADQSTAWIVADHVCRVCFGRILVSTDQRRVRCADCAAAAEGDHSALCVCGVSLGPKVRLECQRQPAPTPEAPCEIVAVEAAP
jgi:hypothetical protein